MAEFSLEAVLNSLDDVIFIFDENDVYLACYTSNTQYLLTSKESLLGKNMKSLIPDNQYEKYRKHAELVRRTGKKSAYEYSLYIDGKELWFLATLYLHPDNRHIIDIIRDVTREKTARDKLDENIRLLEKVQSLARVGTFSVTFADGFFFPSKALCRLLELDSGRKYEASLLSELIDDENKNMILGQINESYKTGVPFNGNIRLRLPVTGRHMYVNAQADFSRDRSGEITRVAGVLVDITETFIIMQELEQARNAAESASMAKSRFLANIGHEIRTPLNGILGFISLLDEKSTATECAEIRSHVEDSGKILLRLIDEILDFSEINEGKVSENHENFNSASFFESIKAVGQDLCTAKNLSFSALFEADSSLNVIGDEEKLRRVILILLENAAKFTNTGGVVFSATIHEKGESAGTLEIRVKDSGIGLTGEQLKSLFTPFYQADLTRKKEYGGLGMGLALARKLVYLLGGEIAASSTFGQGSEFTFKVPVSVVRDNVHPRYGGTVLVVDDNFVNQKLMSKILESLGVKCHVAADGMEAIEKLSRNTYDLVFMDIYMPKMDGLEAIRRIRRTDELKGLPVYAVTASVTDSEIRQYVIEGFNGIIAKPYDKRQIAQILSKR